MNYHKKINLHHILIPLTLLFLSAGCMGHLSTNISKETMDQKMLREANNAYLAKSYSEAEQLFITLKETSQSYDIRQTALYGLACTRFMLAGNQNEFHKAYQLWRTWYESPMKEIYHEDARMFEPVFEKIIFPQISGEKIKHSELGDTTAAGLVDEETSRIFVETLTDNSSNKNFPQQESLLHTDHPLIENSTKNGGESELYHLLESREKEILKLRQQLGRMETNIRSLRNQIRAIEEIHQEIFEKKKGMRLH